MLAGLFSGGNDQTPRVPYTGDLAPGQLLRQSLGLTTKLGDAMGARLGRGISLPSAYVQQPGAYTGGGLPMPIGVVASDPALTNRSLLSRPALTDFATIFDNLSNFGSGSGYSLLDPTLGAQNPAHNAGTTTSGGVAPGEIPTGFYNDPDGPTVYGNGNLNPPTGGSDTGLDPNAFDNFYQQDFNQGTNADGSQPDPNTPVRQTPSELRIGDISEGQGPRRRSDINDGEYGQLVRASDLYDNDTEPDADADDLTRGMGAVQLLLEAYQQAQAEV